MIGINILGYGQMGQQIASLFCLLGCDVTVWNRHAPDEHQVVKNLKLVSKLLAIPVTANTIRIVNSIEELNDQAITIETVIEDIEVKKAIFNQCKSVIKKSYYTNSSSFLPNEISEEIGGLHFFNPINLKLIEYFQSKNLMDDDTNHLFMLLKNQHFNIVPVHANRGYIANFIFLREISHVFKLIEKYGYALAEIDAVYKAFGKYDVFSFVDIVGVDTTYKVIETLNHDENIVYLPKLLKKAIENNILGKKNRTSIRRFLLEMEINKNSSQNTA
jgi:3-hydroxyacyl-CoA dehydrogenase